MSVCKLWLMVLAVSVFSVVSHAQQSADVDVDGAWARAILPGQQTSAAYLNVRNHSTQMVELVGVEVDGAGHAMFHQTVYENGMSKMRHKNSIIVAAQSTVEFKPGGLHIMLMHLDDDFAKRQNITMRLVFADESSLAVKMSLQQP